MGDITYPDRRQNKGIEIRLKSNSKESEGWR